MSACRCSMRTPMAKVLRSMGTPRSRSSSKTSRAECPQARMTQLAATRSSVWEPSAAVWVSVTERTRPPVTSRSLMRQRQRTSPPVSSIMRTMLVTTRGSTSLPTWGLASHRICGWAPASTKVSRMRRWAGLLVPVCSLPSENVPAPPTPYWMLLSTSSSPVALCASTTLLRRAASSPRSTSRGERPALARESAQKRPAQPAPTTTGRASGATAAPGQPKGSSSTTRTPFSAWERVSLERTAASWEGPPASSARRVKVSTMSAFLRASMERRRRSMPLSCDALTRSFLASAFLQRASSRSSSASSCVRWILMPETSSIVVTSCSVRVRARPRRRRPPGRSSRPTRG